MNTGSSTVLGGRTRAPELCVAGSAPLTTSVHDAFRAATGRTCSTLCMTDRDARVESLEVSEGQAQSGPAAGGRSAIRRDVARPSTSPPPDDGAGERSSFGGPCVPRYWGAPASNVWPSSTVVSARRPRTVSPTLHHDRRPARLSSRGSSVSPEGRRVLATHPRLTTSRVGTPRRSGARGHRSSSCRAARSPDREALRGSAGPTRARKMPRRVVIIDTLRQRPGRSQNEMRAAVARRSSE